MSKRDQLRARAARAANRAPAEEPEHPQHPDQIAITDDQPARPARPAPATPPTSRPTTPRTKPVRMTVDLSPLAHERLRGHRNTLREELGVATDVAGAVVIRALLAQLDQDPKLAAAVRDRIADDPSGYGKQ